MTRKIAHAVAALAVFLVASLVWAQPAQAAPGGACSLEEWRNPANFADCARRTREALVEATGCAAAPAPGSPTSGMAGWFARQPDSAKRDGVQGQFSRYGVGGYGLDTYDLGCLGTVKNPTLTGWNAFASAEFSVAAAIMGAANDLRERAYDPGSMWGWSDPLIAQATEAAYRHVFSVFGAITLAGIGLFLLWTARHGRMSQTMKLTAWALFLLVGVGVIARWPIQSVHAVDSAATSGLRVMHSTFGPGPQDVPADQCQYGGDACKDSRSVATRASDVATETVLYRNWLRAVLGTADGDTAKTYGPVLYDATSMQWGEAERVEGNPGLRQNLIEQKADTWNTVAAQIKTDDPVAYDHLQGKHGFDRFGAGLLAVGSAAVFSAFDMTASLVILFGFGLFRIAVPLLPALATIGLFMPASGLVRRIFNMAAAAVFNIVIFGGAAGLYLFIADAVFRSAVLPGPAQIFVVALTGFACFLATQPFRQIVTTVTGRSRRKDGFLTRAFKGGKQLVLDRSQGSTGDPAVAGGVGARPEGATQPPGRRAAKVATDVLAPSIGEAVNHPAVAAAVDAVRNRPEAGAPPASRMRHAAATAATVAATAAGGPAGGAAATAVTTAASRSRAEARS